MLAYHNDPAVKAKYLARVRAHAAADEIIHGTYWENGKGCAVGCIVHSNDHMRFETEIGVPVMLARLCDTIFEGMKNGHSKAWPEEFLNAPRPGADLSLVGWKFLHWLLTNETVNPGINHPTVKDAVRQCAAVLAALTEGRPVDEAAAWSAAESAESAAWSAESAARSAAWSAWSAWSAARSAAWSVWSAESAGSAAWSAWSAAWSAGSAARSAGSAARSAAWSAESAGSAWSAGSAARSAGNAARSAAESAVHFKMSRKLLELMAAA